MQITIVGLHYAPEPSGNAPYTTALSRGLARRGHSVSVVTGVPHYPEWQVRPGFNKWRASSVEDGVKVTRLRHYVPKSPSLPRRAVMELAFGARAATSVRGMRAQTDVVICVSPALLASSMVMAQEHRSRQRPALGLWVQDVYSSGIEELHGGGGRLGGLAQAVERRTLHTADSVAVAHQRFQDRVINGFGLPPSAVRVIRNWTHIATPTESVDKRVARGRLGWGNEVVVLHAGNMGLKQGLTNVVEAARLADERGAHVRFVLMGGGHQEAALKERSVGIDSVEFVGSLDDAEYRAALGAADVLLVNEAPGVNEMSVPSKLTSYFVSGRPVLAATRSDGVTAAELTAAGAGMQVVPGDPSALLEAALLLGADVGRAVEFGLKGRAFAERNLTEEAALDRFEQWITELVEQHPRQRHIAR